MVVNVMFTCFLILLWNIQPNETYGIEVLLLFLFFKLITNHSNTFCIILNYVFVILLYRKRHAEKIKDLEHKLDRQQVKHDEELKNVKSEMEGKHAEKIKELEHKLEIQLKKHEDELTKQSEELKKHDEELNAVTEMGGKHCKDLKNYVLDIEKLKSDHANDIKILKGIIKCKYISFK